MNDVNESGGNTRQQQLQNLIDDLLQSSLKSEWSAPLPFHVEKVVGSSGIELLSEPGMCQDILQYLEPKFRNCRVYFSRSSYDPCNGFKSGARTKTPTAWDKLLVDLSNATIQNGGFHLINNGYTHANSRKLICQHGRCYQKNNSYNGPGRQCNAPNSYRESSFVNNRGIKGRGVKGVKMARRTNTFRPTNQNSTCQFRLTVKCDHMGYYLQNTGHTLVHCNHRKLDACQKQTQSRLLTPEILDTIRTLNTANACSGIGRDIALKKHNTLLSLQQLRYLNGFLPTPSNDEEEPTTTQFDGTSTSVRSSADRVVAKLCGSGKNDVCILQHKANTLDCNEEELISGVERNQITQNNKNTNGVLVDACFATEGGELTGHFENSMTEIPLDSIEEYREMSEFAGQKRNAQKCTDAQHLMIGIAWVSCTAKRWFKLYPHVLFIDVTEDTNKESRPMLTISVKDSSGHHHVVLRAFLPNQRSWSFRWVFQSVMPKLLGARHLRYVNMCLTDGDSQETSQLDMAIQKYFPQARRRRCAYHMITKRWDTSGIRKRVPEGLSCTKADRASIMKLLRDWQYSWTDSQTETASEMAVSVALFIEFVNSEQFSKYANMEDVREILKITRESIIPQEEFFSFHRFSDIRCYDARTTSGHEGTNLALKRGAVAVRPNQSLEAAVSIIEQKELGHDANANVKFVCELTKSKLWSHSATSINLINMGESLLLQQQRLAECPELMVERVSPTSTFHELVFHVARKHPANGGNSSSYNVMIPKFHRVRIVHITGGQMFCSCHYFERFGIPCRHIIRVMLYVNPQHNLTHHDVSVVYWSCYAVYAYNGGNEFCSEDLSDALSALSHLDIKGPKFPIQTEQCSICDQAMLPPDLLPNDIIDSVLNWPREKVKAALLKNNTKQPQYEEQVVFSQDYDSPTSDCSYIDEPPEKTNGYLSGSELDLYLARERKLASSSYQQVIPYAKDLVKRIDNGGYSTEVTPLFLEALHAIEAKLNALELESSSKAVGKYVSCHVDSHKRRKTSHSCWRSHN